MIFVSNVLTISLAAISLYGFFLFLFWWIKKGSASSVYAYVTFLLLGIFVRSLMDYLITRNPLIIESIYWPMRLFLCLLFVSAIVIHMSYRAFVRGNKIEHYINPLHIWCRLLDLNISKEFATWVCKKWEWISDKLKNWSDEELD